jgi:predicted nucleotidyltransferase
MTDKIYTIEEIQRIVSPIASKYNVDRVFLFGSYARGEASGASDIDFVIDKGGLRGLQLAGMLGDLQDIFDKGVDLLTATGIKEDNGYPGFKQRIQKNMVIVYERL